MSQKVISYLNQKGGVGKSTILFHHAHYASELGKKVLVCDFDTQGNASTALLGDDYQEDHEGTVGSGWLLGKNHVDNLKIATNKNGISVIHADESLLDVEDMDIHEVISSIRKNFEMLSEFDLVLIDCPPTVGKRVIGALYASTNVVSPIEPRKFAIDGLASLIQTIMAVRDDHPELNFEGVVINRVNSRSPQQKRNVALIRESLGKQVFLSELVEREPISDAVEEGVPVWSLKKTGSVSAASREMRAILKEIQWRLS